MKHIHELEIILGKYFDWNKSRLNTLVNLVMGLFQVRTVNLSDLATVMYSQAKISAWMLILTIAVIWTMNTSAALKEKVHLAAHGRPRKSVFKNGFERLRRFLLWPQDRLEELLYYMRLLMGKKRLVKGV